MIAFESAEWAWIGFQPLEAVFGFVGFCITCLALSPMLSSPTATQGSIAVERPAEEAVDLATGKHQEVTHDPLAPGLRYVPSTGASDGTETARDITHGDTPSALRPRPQEGSGDNQVRSWRRLPPRPWHA